MGSLKFQKAKFFKINSSYIYLQSLYLRLQIDCLLRCFFNKLKKRFCFVKVDILAKNMYVIQTNA